MSGGHFDYNQYRINDIADSVKKILDTNEHGEYVEFEWERRIFLDYLAGKSERLYSFFSSNPKDEYYVDDFKDKRLFEELSKYLSFTIENYCDGETKRIHFRKFTDPDTWITVFKKPENWKPRYSDQTIEQFKRGLVYLETASVYAQRIDWLVSGDDGEESFHERLAEELANLKKSYETVTK
jgi:hypothetical protein